MLSTPKLSWSACIATLNRHDILIVALTHLLRQSRLPEQVVVVDASDNWEEGRDRALKLFRDAGDPVPLSYVTSAVRSSATQRNLGISMCTSDVVFLIDDDSFLHDDCAEELMRVYDADLNSEIAGVGAFLSDENPTVQSSTHRGQDLMLDRKDTGRNRQNMMQRVLSTKLGQWINREILYQNADMLFMRYDEPRDLQVPDTVAHLHVTAMPFMPGSGMSFRRSIAEKEQFDTALRFYAAFEDLDVGYRIGRHGTILRAYGAKLHHFEAAAGRIKRKKVIAFQLLNMAVFLKRHAKNPQAFLGAYRRMLWRRLAAEFLKDSLSKRWRFPQVIGVYTAMRHWREVWACNTNEIDAWYPEFQRRILEDIK